MKFKTKRESDSVILPDGIYRLLVEKTEEKTGQSGVPYMNVRLKPILNGKVSNQAVWDVISTNPTARFKVDQFLDATQAPEDGEVDIRWFEGKMVFATLMSDMYNGNIRNKVGRYLSQEEAMEQLEALGDDSEYNLDEDEDNDSLTSTWESEPEPVVAKTTKRNTKKAAQPRELEEEEFPV